MTHSMRYNSPRFQVTFLLLAFGPTVTTIELVVTTVESVRDSKSERTSLLNDTIVRVKL